MKSLAGGDVAGALLEFKQAQALDPGGDVNRTAAQALYSKAQQNASSDPNGTKELLQRVIELNTELNFDPGAEAGRLAASAHLKRAFDLLNQENVEAAIVEMKKATELDPKLISADSWNSFCWRGSLLGKARDVLFAGEKAVELNPNSPDFRDSRALARVLAGDKRGAIDDFEYVVNAPSFTTNFTSHEQNLRKQWLSDLKANKNPFTLELLEKLRREDW